MQGSNRNPQSVKHDEKEERLVQDKSPFGHVPHELISYMFSFLTKPELNKAGQTCRLFYHLSRDMQLQSAATLSIDYSQTIPKQFRQFCEGMQIRCVTALSDSMIVMGSSDHYLYTWNIHSGDYLKTFSGHTGSIDCILKLSDNTFISGSSDKSMRIWDITTGECIKLIKSEGIWDFITGNHTLFSEENGQGNTIRCMIKLSDDLIASGSFDFIARIFDIKQNQLVMSLELKKPIKSIAKLSDHELAICAYFHDLIIWDIKTNTTRSYAVQPFCVASFAEDFLIYGDKTNNAAHIINYRTGENVQSFKGHTSAVTSVIKPLDENVIITGSEDGTIRVWDCETLACVNTLPVFSQGGIRDFALVANKLVVIPAFETMNPCIFSFPLLKTEIKADDKVVKKKKCVVS